MKPTALPGFFLSKQKNVLAPLKDGASTFERKQHGDFMRYRVLSITQQGDYLHVRNKKIAGGTRRKVSSKRGEVTGFSSKSRKRLLDLFSKFDSNRVARGGRVLFVTLTYPDNVKDDTRAKRDLKVYMERLQERYPKLWAVWRKEYQKRGAIHFHIMLGGVGYLPVNPKSGGWCANQAWNEVTGSDNARNSVDVEAMRSLNGVMYYVSKYMSKDEKQPDNEGREIADRPIEGSAWGPRASLVARQKFTRFQEPVMGLSVFQSFSQPQQTVGRFWGVYGRKNLPLADKKQETRYVSDSVYRWWLSKVDSTYCNMDMGWTVYTPRAASLLASLDTALKRDGDEGWRQSHWRANAKLAIIELLAQSDELSPQQLRFALLRRHMIEKHGVLFDAP